MFEHTKDKSALRTELEQQTKEFEKGHQVTVVPIGHSAWRYYALCAPSAPDEVRLFLRRTRGDPEAKMLEHKARMAEKARLDATVKAAINAAGNAAYRAARNAGESILNARKGRKRTVRKMGSKGNIAKGQY